ncbi:MAG TPA: 50S ribosomal protein L4 [Gemmatimonadota bacterium]|nr:50S ribosomal protein L4 [Gemmatimonadota bacterium]
MAEASRYTFAGSASGKVQLPDEWFGAEVNKSAVYQAMRAQRTNDRAGTASTKTRALVRGGGAKPWRQKGTGRARAGSNRSPLWKGGGTVFGPTAKDWHERVPQKVRRIAFASALSDKAAEGLVRIVELEAFDQPKTQRLVKALSGWDAEGRVLLLTRGYDDNLFRSGRNVARLTIKKFSDASSLDVLRHDVVVVEDGAWESRPPAGGSARSAETANG